MWRSIMNKKNVVVITSQLLDKDTRAPKIIKTLTDGDYKVTLLCWDRGLKISRSEKAEAGAFQKEISFKFRAPWGDAILLFLPFWWMFIFYQLMITKWDVAYTIQVTSLPPVIIASKLKQGKAIYEILDTYEDTLKLPILIRNLFIAIDKFLIQHSDGIVLADQEQKEEFGGIPNTHITVIYDSPNELHKLSRRNGKDGIFTLFFAGNLSSCRDLNLDNIIAAILDINGVKLSIAGYGDLVPYIVEQSLINPDKIEFVGEVSHAEVLQRSIDSDLLFNLRSNKLLVNKYICGSKLLETMMCGRPILVNIGSSTANKVIEENCGLAIDANDIGEIKAAIIKLKNDPDLCKKLGENARKAYDMKYTWEIMGKCLIAFIDELVSDS